MIKLVPVQRIERYRRSSHCWHKLPFLNLCRTFLLKSTALAEGASRLQACINAVELAIIANSIALDTVFESSMHQKRTLQLPMTMMLGKELLSGLWVRPECRSYCCHSHFCDTASSLFASKCLGERYAWMAALCDLWDPGWGDLRFPHWAFVASITLLLGPFMFFRVVFVLLIFGGHTHDDTRCHR